MGSFSDFMTTYTHSYLVNHTSNLNVIDDQGFINTLLNIQMTKVSLILQYSSQC